MKGRRKRKEKEGKKWKKRKYFCSILKQIINDFPMSYYHIIALKAMCICFLICNYVGN